MVLSGGGARGLAHIGVLEVLEERGPEIQVISGASMGAIVGALWAAGHSAREILELARGIPWLRLFHLRLHRGLLSQERLEALLRQHLPPRFEDLRKPLAVSAVDLRSGRVAYFHEGDLPQAVLASATYPGVLRPVQRGEGWYVDGGVLDNLPLDAARMLGATALIAVNVTPEDEVVGDPQSPFAQIRRSADIMQARLTALRVALSPPELYLHPSLSGIGIEQFGRLEEIVEAGRQEALRKIPLQEHDHA